MLINVIRSSFSLCQIDTSKINLNVLRPWITKRVTEILGMEDDVVVEFVVNQLEDEKVKTILKVIMRR